MSVNEFYLRIFLSAIFMPQFVLKLIAGLITTVDVIGIFLLLIYGLKYNLRNPINKNQYGFVVFIIYVVVFYLVGYISADFDREFLHYILYIFRFVLIFSVVLTFPMLERTILRCDYDKIIIRWLRLAMIFSVLMMLLYRAGYDWFDGSQRWVNADGNEVARMGGLPGETGAFAFNAVVIGFLYFYYSARLNKDMVLTYLILMGYLVLIYINSLARVTLVCMGVFSFCVLFLNTLISIKGKLLCIGVIAFAVATMSLVFINDEFYLRLMSENGNDVSSGRLSNWMDAISYVSINKGNLLFGGGFRAAPYYLGHPLENYVITNIFEIGIFGTLYLTIYFIGLLRPIYLSSKFCQVDRLLLFAWLNVFVFSFFNDVLTFYQTWPVLLFVTFARLSELKVLNRKCSKVFKR